MSKDAKRHLRQLTPTVEKLELRQLKECKFLSVNHRSF